MHIPDPTNRSTSITPTEMQASLVLRLNVGSSDSSRCGLATARALCLSRRFPPMVGTCAMNCTPTRGGVTCSFPRSPARM